MYSSLLEEKSHLFALKTTDAFSNALLKDKEGFLLDAHHLYQRILVFLYKQELIQYFGQRFLVTYCLIRTLKRYYN